MPIPPTLFWRSSEQQRLAHEARFLKLYFLDGCRSALNLRTAIDSSRFTKQKGIQ
jgi:hypothetical protein